MGSRPSDVVMIAMVMELAISNAVLVRHKISTMRLKWGGTVIRIVIVVN